MDGQKDNYTFQIAEVALCAVSYLVDQHSQVMFDQDEVRGLDISRLWERNVWTIDAFIEEDFDEV